MNKFTNKNNKGFTIVETLVAVAILMISVAGPLVIAQKGLMAAIYARDQVTASFLAQEVMEQIKFQRDSYSIDTDPITGGFVNFLVNVVNPNMDCNAKDLLKFDNQGQYSINGTNGDSRFYRGYCFKKFPSGAINENDEITVKVKVSWENGTIENEVVLESELFNISK